jgi:hypothetical protein
LKIRHFTVASVISGSRRSGRREADGCREERAIFRSGFRHDGAPDPSIISIRSGGASTTSSGATSSSESGYGRRSRARSSSSTRFFATWKSHVVKRQRREKPDSP